MAICNRIRAFDGAALDFKKGYPFLYYRSCHHKFSFWHLCICYWKLAILVISNKSSITEDEKRIIARVALTFPTKQMVFDAAHKEIIWGNRSPGELIPYSDAEKLTEI